MDIGITKMSSKGQVVIPEELREDIAEGEKMIIIKNNDQLIMKRAKDFDKNVQEDLIFAKRTEEALKRYDAGTFTSMKADDFLKKLEKC